MREDISGTGTGIRIRSIGDEKDYILTLSFLDDVEFSPYTTEYFRNITIFITILDASPLF